jgi:hypothetical protein
MNPQLEVRWTDPEPFTLTIETTTDGDRIAAEAQQRTVDRQQNDKQQTTLTLE